MKTTKWVGGVVVAILALSVLYLLFQIRGIVNPSYRTETAIYYEMSENIEMTAAAVFEYQTVDGGGLLGYLVEDGERVSPGQTVEKTMPAPSSSKRSCNIVSCKTRSSFCRLPEMWKAAM